MEKPVHPALCNFCAEPAVTNIQKRTGEWHPEQDQRDSTRITLIHFCAAHWSEVERVLIQMSLKT